MADITLAMPERNRPVSAADTSRQGAKAGAGASETSGALWARVARLLFVLAIGILLAAGMIDSITAWKIGRSLSGAAEVAGKVAISTPLSAENCDGTPCAIELAAAAAKTDLLNAGYGEASCIDPRTPSFSGVLVWEFSCGRSGIRTQAAGLCDASENSVCVKVDMTPAEMLNGKLVGYTRATVQYPHGSLIALILTPLPERIRPRVPKSVAGSAYLRDAS